MSSGSPTTIYRPVTGWQFLNFRELWKFRELLWYFAWRDVKVRYKQTILGASWAILQPLLLMLVFTAFLGSNHSDSEIPYPVYVYSGLIIWTLFANSVTSAGNSVVGAGNIVTKIYFPRLIVPFSSIGASILDFCIASTLLACLLVWYQIPIGWHVFSIFPAILLTILIATGIGTLLASLNVSFRDFRYTIPFLIQLWLFATPSVYLQTANQETQTHSDKYIGQTTKELSTPTENSESQLPTKNQQTYRRYLTLINPMNSIIETFRAALFGHTIPPHKIAISTVAAFSILIIGIAYFRRTEDHFADII